MARVLFLTALAFALLISSAAPRTPPSATPSIILAQVYGSICVTQWGTCEVPPQPVDSVCFCGSAQGLIQQ